MEIVMTAQGGSSLQLQRTMTTVVVLGPGEVFRTPSSCERLFVVSGTAWLTDARGDRILWPGQAAILTPEKRQRIPAVISGLRESPLVIEFSGPAAAADLLRPAAPRPRAAGPGIRAAAHRLARALRGKSTG